MKQLFRNLTMTAAVLTALLTANPAAAAAAPHTESVTVTRSGGFASHTEWYAVDSTDRDERAQEALSVTAELRFRVLRLSLPARQPLLRPLPLRGGRALQRRHGQDRRHDGRRARHARRAHRGHRPRHHLRSPHTGVTVRQPAPARR
nr:hypothetical protein GCM10020092_066890 [Actinoplanes digitatis]